MTKSTLRPLLILALRDSITSPGCDIPIAAVSYSPSLKAA
jgi:hypothetical protein